MNSKIMRKIKHVMSNGLTVNFNHSLQGIKRSHHLLFEVRRVPQPVDASVANQRLCITEMESCYLKFKD